MNWTWGDAQLEVVDTATGRRREVGAPSRLCKHALFTRWTRLYRKVRYLAVYTHTHRHTHLHAHTGTYTCTHTHIQYLELMHTTSFFRFQPVSN